MKDKASFFELAELLDHLITIQEPTPLNVEEVMTLISNPSLEQYFFRHLADSSNPGWLEPLKKRGFFDNPPDPIEKDGGIIYPRWAVLWYLVAIITELPEEVLEISKNLSKIDSYSLLELVRAAKQIPAKNAVQMVELVYRWADIGMPIEKGTLDLTIYLAEEGQWDAALSLVDLILSPRDEVVPDDTKKSQYYSPRAVSRAELWTVRSMVYQNLDYFLNHRPIETLEIIQNNLKKAIEIEKRGISSWWRSAIEDHEQNTGSEIKDHLVNAAVKALNVIVQQRPEARIETVRSYLGCDQSIFRRLAIHTIRVNPELWSEYLVQLYENYEYLNDNDVYHEYWLFIHDTFGNLSEPLKHAFLEEVLSKLPQDPIDENEYISSRRWVFMRLCAIKEALPNAESETLFSELKNEFDDPKHPDSVAFLSYFKMLSGSASSISSTDLVNMTPEAIIKELKKDLPQESFDSSSQEGLAEVLRKAITEDPEHFACMAPQFVDDAIPSIYTDRALWGLKDAWKGNKTFDWAPVIELCHSVSQIEETQTNDGQPPDIDRGYWQTTYASARNAVVRLLRVGVIRDDHAIPHRLLGDLRDILLTLADDINPSPEYEENWRPGSPHNVLDLALNVTRSEAVDALIQYALHVSRVSENVESVKKMLLPGSRLEIIVRDKLTEKLDKVKDPSKAVHSVFGTYLPNLYYLDEEWLVTQLDHIFPREHGLSDYWEAAWNGYLFLGNFFGYMYELLKPYYRYALEQMALGLEGKAGTIHSRQRLAMHLAMQYWRGIETLDGAESLIPLLFNNAKDVTRASFVSMMSTDIERNKPDNSSEEWARARALWRRRCHTITQENVDIEDCKSELIAYLSWVPYTPENLVNYYHMIEESALIADGYEVIRLLEYLETVADEHAIFVVSLLEKLLRRNIEPWFLASKKDMVTSILEAAMESSDNQAKLCAIRIINNFGEKGEEHYRYLLKLA